MKCSANHTGPGSAQLVNCTGTFLTLDKFQVVSVFSRFVKSWRLFFSSNYMRYPTLHVRNWAPPAAWKGFLFPAVWKTRILTSRVSSQGLSLREICRGSDLNSEVRIFDKARKPRHIDWRDRQNKTNSDFTIKLLGLDQEFRLQKNVLGRSSGFFFNIAIGNVQQSKWQFQDCSAQGEIYVRNQDSQTIVIGRACDTLISFKKQVQESQKIPVSKQKY